MWNKLPLDKEQVLAPLIINNKSFVVMVLGWPCISRTVELLLGMRACGMWVETLVRGFLLLIKLYDIIKMCS